MIWTNRVSTKAPKAYPLSNRPSLAIRFSNPSNPQEFLAICLSCIQALSGNYRKLVRASVALWRVLPWLRWCGYSPFLTERIAGFWVAGLEVFMPYEEVEAESHSMPRIVPGGSALGLPHVTSIGMTWKRSVKLQYSRSRGSKICRSV